MVLLRWIQEGFTAEPPGRIFSEMIRDRKKGSLRKGSFQSLESLESPKSLDSLESLEYGRILLCFPQCGGSLESLNSLECLEYGLF